MEPNHIADREAMKRALYRAWWPRRFDYCQARQFTHLTLDDRFRQMHGESLTEYHERLRAEAGQ